MYAMLVLTHLYFYCYSAERLLSEVNDKLYFLMSTYVLTLKSHFQSISIAYGVYECKWYDLPFKDAKDLMLIVYRSMIPLKLTAGKFNTFSIEMFGTVRYLQKKTHILHLIFTQNCPFC